ncbi:YsnF/AvaK domain-containing protein [Mucilaginibacter sp. PAMB04274]|uniref:YsnF/AvaK domain-containing protein n=1 Tax=Mucilaginibacter sp. PAMB04274 TaxID=3138568 RepID=UPI0031F71BA4
MSKTVIGIFGSVNQAQEARAYLLANGFSSENVDISTSGSAAYGSNTATNNDEGFGDTISNFFSNLFDDKDEATSHIEAAKNGSTITVHARTEDETLQAVQILDNYGAVDVNEFSEKARTSATDTTGAIPVIEEELQVGKREVETGGVRMRSRIVERPVEESIRLREEHVNIERKPVDRVATEADFAGFKEGTIEVTEHAERPVVAKEARVVEEVSLDKEVWEREETISDTVRHTEVDTEEIPRTEKTYRDTTDPDKI